MIAAARRQWPDQTLRLARLRNEGLNLYLPLPEAQRMHACRAKYIIPEGSNQAGKSLATVAELGRALLGRDPFHKYPPRNGTALLVGLKEDNIAMLWRRLSQPGAYTTILDEHTRLRRAVRPDPHDPRHLDPYDLAYREKWKDSEPLIPPRYLPKGSVAWSDRAKGVPRTVHIPATGWRLELRPSGSPPDQGDHYNVAVNDEEMERPDWYYEEVRGLIGRVHEGHEYSPRLIWDGTSQVHNPEFANLREKALSHTPGFARFFFLIEDNPYISDEEKASFLNALPEGERETRYYGIPSHSQVAAYHYDPQGVHGCEPFPIPENWTRYAILDPGTGRAGLVLLAVDPDEEHVWLYAAHAFRNSTARRIAQKIKELEGDTAFEAFYIDSRAGSQHSLNAQQSTAARFWAAFQEVGLKPRIAGAMQGFCPGNPNVEDRTLALRAWLEPRISGPFEGTPTLQVMRGVAPALDRQIQAARCEADNPRKRAKVTPCEELDDLEYAAAGHLCYHEPEPANYVPISYAVQEYRNTMRDDNCRPRTPCTCLG